MTNKFSVSSIEQVFNGMPGGFFVYRAGGSEEIIYANRAMQRIFKCTSEEQFRELVGNSFKGIVHPDDYNTVSSSILEQISENPYSLDYVEYRIIRSDGSVRWVEDYGRFIHTEEYGDVFYVFIEDATERMKKRMKELERINAELESTQAHESQYQKAILNNALTYFEINLTKDEFISTAGMKSPSGSFDFAGIGKSTKYSEYVTQWSKHTDDKTLEEYRKFFNAERLIECYNNDELEQVFESYATDNNGRQRLFQYVILLGKNEFTGDVIALSIMNDLTNMNEKQRLFQTALSEANVENIASKALLASVSRGIRGPISSITSFTGMIEYNFDDKDMIEYCVKKINDAGKEVYSIVNEALKTIDKNAESEQLINPVCDLSDLLDDMKKRIFPDASLKNINFILDKRSINKFSVYADTIHLEEVLWQLLDNAVKYTDEGGTVSLCVYESEGEQLGYGVYRFEVDDNGTGIREEDIDSIFVPFMRGVGTDAYNNHGKGWGLALVKKMVDMMKGTVSVESTEGQGSRFTVTLTLEHVK